MSDEEFVIIDEPPFDPTAPDKFHSAVKGYMITCPICSARASMQNPMARAAGQFIVVAQPIAFEDPNFTFDADRNLVVKGEIKCGQCGCVLIGLGVEQSALPQVCSASEGQLKQMTQGGILLPGGKGMVN